MTYCIIEKGVTGKNVQNKCPARSAERIKYFIFYNKTNYS